MNKFVKILLLFFVSLVPFAQMKAAEEIKGKQAEEMFNKIYDLVFGEKGSALTYSVNIIGLYKTEGNIMYKGKKIMYREKRYMAWEDGVTAHMVDRKKHEVNIYRYDDDNKDEMLSKFKYNVNDYTFSYKAEGDYYLVNAKLKKSSLFGIKSVTAKVKKENLYPVSLTINLALFRTTVNISNFRSGNISDNNFVFPRSDFSDYKFIDHR